MTRRRALLSLAGAFVAGLFLVSLIEGAAQVGRAFGDALARAAW